MKVELKREEREDLAKTKKGCAESDVTIMARFEREGKQMVKKRKWQPMFGTLRAGCEGRPSFYADIFSSKMQVNMCLGRNDDPEEMILVLRIRQADKDEENQAWGWLEPNGKITMIWASKFQLDTCFPYGPEIEEKAGKGIRVPVIIKEVKGG